MATVQPFKSPKGVLNWVIITGEGKINMSGKLKYNADLVLPKDSDEAKKLIDFIDEYWLANLPTGFNAKRAPKSTGYRDEMIAVLDKDGEKQYGEDGKVMKEATGNVVFTFSTDTTYPSGDQKKVVVFNAKGNKVDLGSKKIGNLSEGRISGAVGVYTVKDPKGKTITDAGTTLYLNSVMLTKFVEFSGEEQWDADEDGDGWTGEGETEDFNGEPGQDVGSSKGAPRL